NRIGSVLITGDFFVTPPRVVYDLEGVLRGLPLDRLPGTLDCFFRDTDIEVLSVGKDDFLSSLQAAIDTQGAPHDGH
ncbi:MAG: lipoate--protein ligase family protein, partial [Xanthomonadales bacterium]|nr:lipoate--protein ligase family protein [Xanthomonadales bacterium]NIN58951.1 lipoate--protein ligase family protein [Xanthomonadales bacterium]NIN74220.1 lipoate--protein ligase family protein [Xanthomonadales bacterium]NIO13891.1 lipoate--protein ligase family protein [Xanthomonadales bacterium]NIP11344.1 lipoate--protein ligase family protein [Xanthomonadales bacterium]